MSWPTELSQDLLEKVDINDDAFDINEAVKSGFGVNADFADLGRFGQLWAGLGKNRSLDV